MLSTNLYGHKLKPVATFFLFTSLLLVAIGLFSGLGIAYYLSICLASIIFAGQVLKIGPALSKELAFAAFKSNVLAGFLILIGIIIDTNI